MTFLFLAMLLMGWIYTSNELEYNENWEKSMREVPKVTQVAEMEYAHRKDADTSKDFLYRLFNRNMREITLNYPLKTKNWQKSGREVKRKKKEKEVAMGHAQIKNANMSENFDGNDDKYLQNYPLKKQECIENHWKRSAREVKKMKETHVAAMGYAQINNADRSEDFDRNVDKNLKNYAVKKQEYIENHWRKSAREVKKMKETQVAAMGYAQINNADRSEDFDRNVDKNLLNYPLKKQEYIENHWKRSAREVKKMKETQVAAMGYAQINNADRSEDFDRNVDKNLLNYPLEKQEYIENHWKRSAREVKKMKETQVAAMGYAQINNADIRSEDFLHGNLDNMKNVDYATIKLNRMKREATRTKENKKKVRRHRPQLTVKKSMLSFFQNLFNGNDKIPTKKSGKDITNSKGLSFLGNLFNSKTSVKKSKISAGKNKLPGSKDRTAVTFLSKLLSKQSRLVKIKSKLADKGNQLLDKISSKVPVLNKLKGNKLLKKIPILNKLFGKTLPRKNRKTSVTKSKLQKKSNLPTVDKSKSFIQNRKVSAKTKRTLQIRKMTSIKKRTSKMRHKSNLPTVETSKKSIQKRKVSARKSTLPAKKSHILSAEKIIPTKPHSIHIIRNLFVAKAHDKTKKLHAYSEKLHSYSQSLHGYTHLLKRYTKKLHGLTKKMRDYTKRLTRHGSESKEER